MAIIGIDLGTTNSLASIWKDGESVLIPNSFGEFLTPSVVSIGDDGTITVGKTAQERLISHPENTVASFKRFMGTDKTYTMGGKFFTTTELSALVLRKLREDAEKWLNEPVTEAIISVPAYFNDAQRAATKRAGALSGLHVERLINEPSAAALACHIQNLEDDGCFLVFDLGGGTLDVSVVEYFENIVEIISIAGSNHLGGDDFDLIIAKHFCKRNNLNFDMLSPNKKALLISGASKCKCALSESNQSLMVFELPDLTGTLLLTNEMLIELSAELFIEMRNVVGRAFRDCNKRIDEIDQVVFVGGSCNMKIVQNFVYQLLNETPLKISSPDKTVALGVGVYAGIKARNGDIRDILLTDICPFSLGVGIHNPANPAKNLMSPIIERNSTLPISKVERYNTVENQQVAISLNIYQGEEMYADDNLLLGKIEISIPPAPAGEEKVDVRFTYDINGLLDIDITSVSTQKTVNQEIISKGNDISKDQIERKRKELAQLKAELSDMEENNYLIARAQRLYVELTGRAREVLVLRLQRFEQVLSTNKQIASQKEQLIFSEFLDDIENGLFNFESEDDEQC